MKGQLTLILTFVFSNFLFAQEHKDCTTPLVLCGESPFSFTVTEGVGNDDEITDGTCVGTEYNSIWIELNVVNAGDLIFDIMPKNGISDFDFLVLKKESENCDENEVVRCMATGATAGNPNNENCTGNTGLQYGETDIVEEPGCNQTDNNYLAPLEVFHGDRYLLLINNFSDTVGFDLVLGGTAEIHCITTTTNKEIEKADNFDIVSSTVVSDQLIIQTANNIEDGKLYIVNMLGQVVHQQNVRANDLIRFDPLFLSGTHVVLLQAHNQLSSETVIFIK